MRRYGVNDLIHKAKAHAASRPEPIVFSVAYCNWTNVWTATFLEVVTAKRIEASAETAHSCLSRLLKKVAK